ncbi:hypothetical protein [Mongoliitalea lutea]|uniref:Glycosyltransferase n=1 Tax=Mongoliitalea lutea TaxID=849756 RepID=A0A8J3D0S0_9BACT|nr:hypothetical protein [Mongoliitalea lutea]GHB44462.1 hypothetical protein GCM10008106_26920 [Mongoliitalea lutea]
MTEKKKAPARTRGTGATSKKAAATKELVAVQEESAAQELKRPHVHKWPEISVVIPFRKDKAEGDELLYAVRAWAKNFPQAKIVVIGDALPWFSKEIIHISFEDSSDNAQVNTTGKIMAAIASADVTEQFLLSCDDIYPVTPLDGADFLILRANATPLKERRTKGGHYQKNLERTVKALNKAGIVNPHDYDTHTPYFFDKEVLADVIAFYDCAGEDAKLLPSLYFNSCYPHIIPLKLDPVRGQYVGRVVNTTGNDGALSKAFEERKYINHDHGCYKRCEPFLKAKFFEKSRFEK